MTLLAASTVFKTIGSVLAAILILLFMITVHEFGHYIAGKIFKFKINEFAIGMGPKIFSRKSETTGEVFSVRALPLGGFCAFEGEDDDIKSEDSFNSKAPYKRIIVLMAGATVNFICGVLILMLSVGIYGQIMVNCYDVRPDAVYQEYSLQNDDVILKIDGKNVYMASDILTRLNGKHEGDIVKVTVKNNGQKAVREVKLRNSVNAKNLTDSYAAFTALGVATIEKVTAVTDENPLKLTAGDYILRIADSEVYDECTRVFGKTDLAGYVRKMNDGESLRLWLLPENGTADEKYLSEPIVKYALDSSDDDTVMKMLGIKESDSYLKYRSENVKFGFFGSIGRGIGYSFSISGTIFRTLGELLTGKLGLSAMGGPITTITATTTVIKTGGFHYFLEIAGFIGVNLAVFNLLPIPALDGSRIVFCIIEWIRKKPLNRKVEAVIHGVGLILLLGFCVLVDILQLF